MVPVRSRAVAFASSLAIAASLVVFGVPLAASAQTCPYNSTQGTCACPTTGGGTTCFGGQLFRSTDNTCQNDTRPCASNQQFSCSSVSCTCNTAAFPCGGCTAASSTIGASCGSPTGGQYTNICGACACPAGTTLCASGSRCVTNRVCPAGTTWDPCTDTCGTPNVLLSPSFTQNGFIDVAGDWINRAGNFRLDYSNGAGVGDFYVASGKSLRVDGAGVTSLNVANYGAGGTGLNVNFPATSQLCFGATCRNSWPSTTDFNPTYVNANGDSMTGDLNLTGAGTDLFVAGSIGVGTTTPAGRLDVRGATAIGPVGLSFAGHLLDVTHAGPITTPFVTFRDNTAGVELDFSRNAILQRGSNFILDTDAGDLDLQTFGTSKLFIQRTSNGGNVGIGTTSPGAKLDVNGTAKMTGLQLTTGAGAGKMLSSDATGNASWITLPASIGGSGTANYLPKFTAATTVGNSQIFDNGTNVAVNATAPNARFQVESDTYDFPSGSQQRRFTTSMTGAQIFLNDNSGVSILTLGTGPGSDDTLGFNMNGSVPMAITAAGNVGIGNTSPGQKLDVTGAARVNAGGPNTNAGLEVNGTSGTWGPSIGIKGATEWRIGNLNGNALNFTRIPGSTVTPFTIYDTAAANTLVVNTNGVGVKTASPAVSLAVGGPGANVYATDEWVENNIHVQGNETVGAGRGRLRVGTAWNKVGLYAETNSAGQINDLVLGASSNHVHINAGSFGQPNAGTTLELWGSRLSDTGSGILTIDSGGSITNVNDPYLYVNGKETIQNTDSWLRLNQSGVYSSGVHTPGNFAPGALNVGGANGWGNPGGGNVWIAGSTTNYGNLNVVGDIVSNYYQSWWTADAWNGGYWQGQNNSTTADHICILLKTEIRGAAGGRCDTWQGGDGYWWRSAWSAGTGEVHCAWNCFKYR